jgi:hypothetical protein
MVRVLVCGGRDFKARAYLYDVLDTHHKTMGPFTWLVEGGAPGADSLAAQWAESRGVEGRSVAADWSRDGRTAGPLRNRRMLVEDKPDLVIAFPGGRGTANMVAQARGAGIRTISIRAPTPDEAPSPSQEEG